MSDLDKILITSFLTILGGLLVFVAGQFILKFIIDPLHALKKTIGEIEHALIYHAPAIQTPVGKTEREDAAQEALRKLSCDLRVNIESLPLYSLLIVLYWKLPSKKNGLSAASRLIGLSNGVHEKDRSENYDIANFIRRKLNITEPE
jgi:hypothetical protein